MGLFDAIFGSPSKSKASSTPVDMTPEQFEALRGPLADALKGLLSGGSQGFNALNAPPAPTAPMGAAETAAIADVNAMATDPTRRALLQQTMAGNFLPGAAGGNPMFAAELERLQRPTMEALQHAVGRQIPSQFAVAGHQVGQQVGQGGSTAKDLQTIRASEIGARALGDIATGFGFQVHEAERGRQMQAIPLSQGEIQIGMDNIKAQSGPRLIQQMGVEQGRQAFENMFTQYMQFLALISGTTAPAIANQAQSTSTGQGQGLFGQIFPKGLFAPSPSNIGVTG